MHEKLGFTHEVAIVGDHPVVVFAGDLDLSAAEEAWSVLEPLIGLQISGLTIDIGGLGFIDSRGLNVLVHALQALDGTPLTLRNTPERIVHLLNVSGVAGRVQLA